MAVPTRPEVEAMIAERIAADPSFREALLANPRAVIADLVGFNIPDSVEVVLHEESLTQIHLLVPASGQLSDSDLELAAGGSGGPGGGRFNLGMGCLTCDTCG